MLKKIIIELVLFGIILVSLIGAVNAEQGMLTYTNGEYGFSIEYPEDWTVEEGSFGTVVMFMGPIKDDFIITVNVVIEELQIKMTVEEYYKAGLEWYQDEYEIVETLSDTINGEAVAGDITTYTMDGTDFKNMQVCFVRDKTGYVITFDSVASAYDKAEADYFDPMLMSFKFIEKEAAIRIHNFIITPTRVEPGEEVKVKFEAVNEADVEKTKTFHLIDMPPGDGLLEEIDFRTVTLAPGETEIIEFTFIPKETGEHTLSVEGQYGSIVVRNAILKEVSDTSSGYYYMAVFVIIGILAVVLFKRRE